MGIITPHTADQMGTSALLGGLLGGGIGLIKNPGKDAKGNPRSRLVNALKFGLGGAGIGGLAGLVSSDVGNASLNFTNNINDAISDPMSQTRRSLSAILDRKPLSEVAREYSLLDKYKSPYYAEQVFKQYPGISRVEGIRDTVKGGPEAIRKLFRLDKDNPFLPEEVRKLSPFLPKGPEKQSSDVALLGRIAAMRVKMAFLTNDEWKMRSLNGPGSMVKANPEVLLKSVPPTSAERQRTEDYETWNRMSHPGFYGHRTDHHPDPYSAENVNKPIAERFGQSAAAENFFRTNMGPFHGYDGNKLNNDPGSPNFVGTYRPVAKEAPRPSQLPKFQWQGVNTQPRPVEPSAYTPPAAAPAPSGPNPFARTSNVMRGRDF